MRLYWCFLFQPRQFNLCRLWYRMLKLWSWWRLYWVRCELIPRHWFLVCLWRWIFQGWQHVYALWRHLRHMLKLRKMWLVSGRVRTGRYNLRSMSIEWVYWRWFMYNLWKWLSIMWFWPKLMPRMWRQFRTPSRWNMSMQRWLLFGSRNLCLRKLSWILCYMYKWRVMFDVLSGAWARRYSLSKLR